MQFSEQRVSAGTGADLGSTLLLPLLLLSLSGPGFSRVKVSDTESLLGLLGGLSRATGHQGTYRLSGLWQGRGSGLHLWVASLEALGGSEVLSS